MLEAAKLVFKYTVVPEGVAEKRDTKGAVVFAVIAGVSVTTTTELDVFKYGAAPVIVPVGKSCGKGVWGTNAELVTLLLDGATSVVMLVVEVDELFEVTETVRVSRLLVALVVKDEAVLVPFTTSVELDEIVDEETLLEVLDVTPDEDEVLFTLDVLDTLFETTLGVPEYVTKYVDNSEVEEAGAVPRTMVPGSTVVVVVLVEVVGGRLVGRVVRIWVVVGRPTVYVLL